jgi:uncharacterized protein
MEEFGEMSRIGNESMAELVRAHPDRFAGFMACVPMDDASFDAFYARAAERSRYEIWWT